MSTVLPAPLTVEAWDKVKFSATDLGRAPMTAFDGTRFIRRYSFNALETASEEVAEQMLNACKWINRGLNLYFGKAEGGPGFETALERLHVELLQANP